MNIIEFIKIRVLLFLLFIPVIITAGDIKLGEPVKVNLIEKFYGEELISEQEGGYSNVYANYEERYILYDINLYRLAPQILSNEDVNPDPDIKKCLNWGYCFQPVKPMYWNLDLSRAARYHSDDMIRNECFEHNDCDGGSIWDRIKSFYSSSKMGENIAAGSNYINVTKNFINETGASLGTTGHRDNIFEKDFDEVGLGYLKGGEYRLYTTQDFGASAIPSVIPSGIHEPLDANKGSKVKFKAIYHGEDDNPNGWLILNGKIYPLTKNISSNDWKKEDYIGSIPFKERNWVSIEYVSENIIENSCNKYSFLFISNEGKYRYPDIGSLIAGKNCSELYDSEVVVIDETDFEEIECKSDSCTEVNKTICTISNYQLSCSCDDGYSYKNNLCQKDTTPAVNYSGDDSCNYGISTGSASKNSNNYLFFLFLMIIFVFKKYFILNK